MRSYFPGGGTGEDPARISVLGDATYASGFKGKSAKLAQAARKALQALGRQALHAAELGFEHPVTAKKQHFSSAPPGDMADLLTALALQD